MLYGLLRQVTNNDNIHILQDGGIIVALLGAAASYGSLKTDQTNTKDDLKARGAEIDSKFASISTDIKEVADKVSDIHTAVAILVSNEKKRESGLLKTRLDDNVSK